MPRLTSERGPLSPYRVIWDLMHIADVAEHDHHARRRQPARRALAVLEVGDAAVVHRLGQEHAARLRPRPGDGREAREPGQALHQHVGRRGHRHDRHGLRDGVRCNIPIMSILFNNFSMAMEFGR
jgi:acetolactate synthase I/II/III large subunit